MFVRITSPRSDKTAREFYNRFKDDGYCQFTVEGTMMGFLTDAREEDGDYILTVKITDPDFKLYLAQQMTKTCQL